MKPEHGLVDWGIMAIFVTVYAGMILGGLPRLKLDRSGVALLFSFMVVVARLCLQRRLNPVPFLLGLVSTLAGNLLLVGSIANLIVVDLAQKSGVLIN